MDDKLRLTLDCVGSIKKDETLCVVQLKENTNGLYLTFITDHVMGRELLMRLDASPIGKCKFQRLLPEVMWESLRGFSDSEDYEMCIEKVESDGEYLTVLYNKIYGGHYEIRLADAVLLQEVSGIPLYIRRRLAKSQMFQSTGKRNVTALPLNVMPLDVLEKSLAECIENEDYRTAQRLNEEINKRKSIIKEDERDEGN
ncbi:MAG: hypothetical protein ACI3YT_09605 [Prevotella sp.]